MALKSLAFAIVLCILGAAPMIEAQLGINFNMMRIRGTLFCTQNGNMGVNGTATPVFPNAMVQLQCGGGNVISSATTNSAGEFSMILDSLQYLVSSLLTDCNLVVKTPLSTCNSALPSFGILKSTLELIGNIVQGILNITDLRPSGFNLLPMP